MKKNIKLVSVVVLLVVIANLSIHLYLASNTRFISDDFCSASMAERLGVFRATWYWYLNWSGRYSASMLDSFFGLLGPKTTAVVLPFILIFWMASLVITICQLFHAVRDKIWYSLILGANILFLTLLLAPNVRQSIYWGQGMRSVLPPMILFTLYMGWFQWHQTRDPKRKKLLIWLSLSFLFAFGVGGFSETFAVVQLLLIFMGLVVEIVIKNRFNWKTANSKILYSAFAGAALAIIVIVVAPGNAFRQAQLPPSPDIAGILEISIRSFIVFLQGLVGSTEKVLGLLGCMGVGVIVGYQVELPRSYTKYSWLLILAFMFLVMYVCFPPAAFGLSDAPPARTLIIPVYIFSVAVTVFGVVIGNQLHKHTGGGQLVQGISVVAMIMFIAANYLADATLINSRHIFVEFANKWDQRQIHILADKDANKKQVVVPTMDDVNWAYATTIHDSPKFWLNQCVSLYYGIETIAVDDFEFPENEAQ